MKEVISNKCLTIETRRVSDLKPYINNPRKNDEAVSTVEKSIKEFGFINPIVLDEHDSIIVGHTRLKAAIKLGYTEVPTIKAEHLTPDQVKAFRIMDNKSGEKAEWDWSLLKEELYDLEDTDSFDATGLESEEITDVWDMEEDNKEVQEDNFTEPKKAKYKVSVGDVFVMGQHRLMCGDATDFAMVKELCNDEKMDMVFTDPPYNVNIGAIKPNKNSHKFPNSYASRSNQRTIKNDHMKKEDFNLFLDKVTANIIEITSGAIYIFMSCKELGNMMRLLEKNKAHWSSTIVWNKSNFVLSQKDYHSKYEPIWYGWKEDKSEVQHLEDRSQSDVWDFKKPMKSELHPTMKPLELCSRAIKNSSKPNQSVLDLFGGSGSGSTLIACEQTNRKCYMMELDEHYVSVIMERWEKVTGEKAKKLSGGFPDLNAA